MTEHDRVVGLALPDRPLPDRVSMTRPIAANRREAWVTLDGPGCIRHLWITLKHPKRSTRANRKIILRLYFDGSSVPQVEAPVGDFFGVMHGEDYYPIDCHWLSVTAYSSYNCYFPMPFAESARIELETGDEANHCYMQLDWHRYPGQAMTEPRRFCCRWRKEHPTQRYGEDYLVLDAEGPGQLLGFVYGVRLIDNEDRWSHGGSDNLYIDGESDRPAFVRGIGGEDTFGASYGGAHHPPETRHFAAMPYYEHEDIGEPRRVQRLVGYRFFEADRMPFERSLHMRFGCMANNICSTVYWYQAGEVRPFTTTPPFEALMPDAELPRGAMDVALPACGAWAVRCPIDNAEDAAIKAAAAGKAVEVGDETGATWIERPSLRGFVDFNHVSRPRTVGVGRHHTHMAGQARASFEAPAAGKATLRLTFDDHMVVQWNGGPPIDLGDHRFFRTRVIEVELNAGANDLQVTLSNTSGTNHGGWVFACRLVTADGTTLRPSALQG